MGFQLSPFKLIGNNEVQIGMNLGGHFISKVKGLFNTKLEVSDIDSDQEQEVTDNAIIQLGAGPSPAGRIDYVPLVFAVTSGSCLVRHPLLGEHKVITIFCVRSSGSQVRRGLLSWQLDLLLRCLCPSHSVCTNQPTTT